MPFDSNIHHRRSIRLPKYDYRQPNAYFVTICVYQKGCLFGDIIGGEMKLNEIGRMVKSVWDELPEHYSDIELDEFVVMPNHVHGIVWINDVGAQFIAPNTTGMAPNTTGMAPNTTGMTSITTGIGTTLGMGAMNRAPTLGDIVRSFKARVTYSTHRSGISYFGWQRNYHERVIRSERELYAVREYVRNNPAKWEEDPENIGRNIGGN